MTVKPKDLKFLNLSMAKRKMVYEEDTRLQEYVLLHPWTPTQRSIMCLLFTKDKDVMDALVKLHTDAGWDNVRISSHGPNFYINLSLPKEAW